MIIKTSIKSGRRVLIVSIDATVPEDVPDAPDSCLLTPLRIRAII